MKFPFAAAIIILLMPDLSGQSVNKHDEPTSVAVRELYNNSIASPLDMINGKEYLNYYYRCKTTPLLFKELFFTSKLTFNGRIYNDVRLQYDTYLDEVVYTDTSRMLNFEYPKIALNKQLVNGFIFSHNGELYDFRHLSFQDQGKNSLSEGFYEVVYDGPSMFLIKHRATLFESEAIIEYKYSPVKYVFIDGAFRKFTKMKDLTGLLGTREEEIRKYLHEKKIRMRRTGKYQIADVLQYYDSSSN